MGEKVNKHASVSRAGKLSMLGCNFVLVFSLPRLYDLPQWQILCQFHHKRSSSTRWEGLDMSSGEDNSLMSPHCHSLVTNFLCPLL